MEKIIAYSLYSSNRCNVNSYINGALKNQDLIKVLYPDFISRFYLSEDMINVGNILKDKGAEVFYEKVLPFHTQTACMWRYKVLLEDDFDVVLFRDVDSYLSKREKNLVDIFLESDKNFHIIRDNIGHTNRILAGMFGAKKTDTFIKENINKMLNIDQMNYGDDEKILQNIIYPYIQNDSLEHDSNIDNSLFYNDGTDFFIGKPFR
jgi:hypothetical protein